MGIKVNQDNVKKGLTNQNKAALFSGYNGNDSDYISIVPKSDECAKVVTVEYDTNFAITATDASTLTELIKLAKGVVPLVSSSPNANTIINGVEALDKSINSIVDSESNSGSQEFRFTATPCPTEPKSVQCYRITLLVIGKMIVTDADITDEEERAELTLTLSAKNNTKSKSKKHSKRTNSPVVINEQISVNVESEDPFSIYVKLDEYCQTDGPGIIGSDSASVIRIDFVKIIIETLTCDSEDEEKIEENEKNKDSSSIGKPIIGEKALKRYKKRSIKTK